MCQVKIRSDPDPVFIEDRIRVETPLRIRNPCLHTALKASTLFSGFLRRGKEDKLAPPIIEMVPVANPPSTYQFPSRFHILKSGFKNCIFGSLKINKKLYWVWIQSFQQKKLTSLQFCILLKIIIINKSFLIKKICLKIIQSNGIIKNVQTEFQL